MEEISAQVVSLSWVPGQRARRELKETCLVAGKSSGKLSLHMTHCCSFVLDKSCSLVGTVQTLLSALPFSRDGWKDPHEEFQESLQESFHFMKSTMRRVRVVSSGDCLVCFGCDDAVWSFGMNTLNPHEISSRSNELEGITPRLEQMEPAVHALQLAVGLSHVLVVDDEGYVWTAGQGTSGELGIGRKVDFQGRLEMIDLPNPRGQNGQQSSQMRAVQVYAGARVSVVVARMINSSANNGLITEDCMYTFGSGAYFKLGHGDGDSDELSPRVMEWQWNAGTQVLQVACGRFHMVFLCKHTHDVYVWGWAKFGQFSLTSTEVEELHRDPHLLSSLDEYLDESKDEKIVQVECGARHVAFRTSEGHVLSTGVIRTSDIQQCRASDISSDAEGTKKRKLNEDAMMGTVTDIACSMWSTGMLLC